MGEAQRGATLVKISMAASEATEAVEADVRVAFSVFETLHRRLCPSSRTEIHIQISDDFEGAARALHDQLGDQLSRPYTARREFGQAVGKTFIQDRAEYLQATLLLDAAPISTDLRIPLLVHEFGHVLFRALLKESGEPSVPPVGQRSFEETFLSASELLWEEFQVDRLVDKVLTTTDADGRVVAGVDRYRTGLDEIVRQHLDAFCYWVVERVQRYRVTFEGLAEIWEEGAPRLDQMFTALVHAIGHYSAADRVTELRALLAASPGFEAFLEDDWSTLVEALDRPRSEAVPILRDVLLRTMRRLGFSTEMTERGLYVHVYEPQFCGECSPTS